MNRNYRGRRDIGLNRAKLTEWAGVRETHEAVACAIHAIADKSRSADSIWENPTVAESDHVKMAVEEYIAHGDFPAGDNDIYPWGVEIIALGARERVQ